MGNFWPSDVILSDARSPREILEVAKEEWDTQSDGLMTLALQDTTSPEGNDMIIVHAKHVPSNRTSRMFAVICKSGTSYPVSISYTPNTLRLLKDSDFLYTPAEFRKKLAEEFNRGLVKSKIFNLMTVAPTFGNVRETVEEFPMGL